MILLEDYRIRPPVRIDSRGDVPAESERAEEVASGTELHQVALGKVVPSVSAVEYAPVGGNYWRRRFH